MLEVLDPEQNKTFNDHYLEVDYDLSRVLFITTANTTQGIPLPLQDRMEIIRISGYTDLEKHEIARRHLIPKSIKGNGLKRSQMKFQKAALDHLIHGYTRESGVRNLEREITSLCRKVAMMHVEAAEAKKAAKPVSLTPKLVRELLGPEHYKDTALDRQPEIGNVIGLAWTEVGGELLHVEVRTMGGKGNLTLTGKLGEVMQESGKTALSLIRSQASELGIDPKFHENTDIHVHLPEGAIPKDGPSAGISLATSIVSALSKVPVRQDVAMTGELTLRGKVLKIGGLKEKVLAAYRNRIRTIIMPEENLPDLEEIPKEVRAKTTFITVSDLAGVLKHALAPQGQKKKPAPKVRPRPRTQA
jgi:ATP-dependent Lon protease